MNDSWIYNAGRVGFAAALALSAEAGAFDWCPTQAINTLSCSNCTATLTCDVQGQIRITGTNVHLAGNYHWVSFNTGHGITVSGGQVHISKLAIYAPEQDGIKIEGSGSNSFTASEVDIYYAGGNGVTLSASYLKPTYAQLMSSDALYSAFNGMAVYSYQGNSNMNVYDSYLQSNPIYGFRASEVGYQTHARNAYNYNGSAGVYTSSSRNGGSYTDSNFDSNYSGGLAIANVIGPQKLSIINNSGFGNSWLDCYASSNYKHFSANSWGSQSGCVTSP